MIKKLWSCMLTLLCLALWLPAAAQTYTNEPASIIWPFNDATKYENYTATPDEGFSLVSVDLGGTVKATEVSQQNNLTYLKINPTTASSQIKWSVKPTKGLTFTPTKVRANIGRAGTDVKDGMTVTAELSNGTIVKLGTYTGHRINKAAADDKYSPAGNEPQANHATYFEITLTEAQQKQLASADGFSLCCTHGVAADGKKQGAYSDVTIEGLLNGTVENVEKFEVKLAPSIEGAGSVSAYPAAESYDKGTEINVSTVKNFGYKFINWTDSEGSIVSTEANFTYIVEKNTTLTANYQALTTYELTLEVEGGANDYMVQATPAPTVVGGKNMYEEGTNVTLKATGNPIFTFTNWSDGQSSSEIQITMDSDKAYTASFSGADYIVGWDFYQPGNNGRLADFHSEGNDAVALNLRNDANEIQGWLDKSTVAGGGYETMTGAAVNWRVGADNGDVGNFYFQTNKINASAFTDIRISTDFLFNYNTYTTQIIEYSLDGEKWEEVTRVTMANRKTVYTAAGTLPAKADNAESLYFRWFPDRDGAIDGTSSKNDGLAIGNIFITGTAKLIDDGTAPVLVSTVPADGNDNASINGKIVLTFDEKIKVAEGTKATIGDIELEPAVTGKTITFAYKNLTYGTGYTFNLPANCVMDLTDNKLAEAVTINFQTKTRPAVSKAIYDVEVSTADELAAAIEAANNREGTDRFRIYIHNGTYKLPASTTKTKTGTDGNTYPDPTTYITKPNISFIGESMDGVVITNTPPSVTKETSSGPQNVLEGIGQGDVMRLEKEATGCYFQHITMKSSMGDSRGRDIVLNDNSNKTIFKDACLWGYQDTYVSNNQNGRFYFEGGLLRGRTDFLCGKGDVFYQSVELQMCEQGGYLAVPSVPKEYGYVFKDCEITGSKDVDGNYTLGRPWGSGTPIAVFIDTKMTVKPSAIGWNDMGSDGYPKRFAEYNSITSEGTVIDLASRKKTFGQNSHSNNPVLTKEEADSFNYNAVMGADDDWDPAADAEQAPAPTNVVIDKDGVIEWDHSDYALCWAVYKDGKLLKVVTEATLTDEDYAAPAGRAATPVYTVRAANEMGGLGEEVQAVPSTPTSITDIAADSEVVSTVYYNIQGIAVSANTTGILIKVETLADGSTRTSKVIVK